MKKNKLKDAINSNFGMALAILLSTLYFWNALLFNYNAVSAPSNQDQFSRSFLYSLTSEPLEKLKSLFEPGYQVELEKAFPKIEGALKPYGEIQSVHLIENQDIKDKSEQVQGKGLRYYVDYKNGSELIQVVSAPQGNSFQILGLYFNSAKLSYEELFPFQLKNRSWLQYTFLLLAYGLFLACTVTFVKCLKNPTLSGWKKALWCAAILTGTINLNMYWLPSAWLPMELGDSTATNFNLKFFLFFPSGITKIGLYNPWKIWISFPIGMVAYYSKAAYQSAASSKKA
ncbi:MAG TPA: hypothetical protein VK791_08085 [bacterium]|jgi:hypothetical protein|nr:hypothetical protein [bacterium]